MCTLVICEPLVLYDAMLMCLHHNLVSDLIRPSLVPVEVAFGSSLCVRMSNSLSVLLVPLQELQIEGHYTSTVVGCVLSGSPSSVGVTRHFIGQCGV